MYRFIQLTVFMILLACSILARAEQVSDLSTASISVSDRSEQQLQDAFRRGLADVLVRLSGNTSVMTLPALQSAQANAKQYIQSYQYKADSANEATDPLHVVIQFDQQALDSLLQASGQAVWAADRPLTLVWVRVNDNILSSSADDAQTQVLHRVAAQRGLPILLPTMDMEDQGFIGVDDTTSFDAALLQSAEKRYGVHSLLAGYLQPTATGWSARWLMMLDNEPVEWRAEGKTPADVLAAGLNQMADLMVSRLAVLRDDGLQRKLTLAVSGIGDLSEYATVMKTLEALAPVREVRVEDMKSDTLLLTVMTTSTEQVLKNALAKDAHFEATQANASLGTTQVDLFYRWISPNGVKTSSDASGVSSPAPASVSDAPTQLAPPEATEGRS